MLITIDSEKLGNLIEKTLINYNFDDIFEEEECLNNYSFVDKLCLEGETVDKGKERIVSIVDAIICDLIDHKKNKE
jgi:hypothetical protein